MYGHWDGSGCGGFLCEGICCGCPCGNRCLRRRNLLREKLHKGLHPAVQFAFRQRAVKTGYAVLAKGFDPGFQMHVSLPVLQFDELGSGDGPHPFFPHSFALIDRLTKPFLREKIFCNEFDQIVRLVDGVICNISGHVLPPSFLCLHHNGTSGFCQTV